MTMPQNPFFDIGKMMDQFKQFQLPGLDVNALVEARRKDMEALTIANQATIEGLQALAQRQAEILKEATAQWQAAMTATGGTPAEIQARQAELTRRGIETALNNMRELAEMAAKSQGKALEAVTLRAQQNLEELKNLMQPSRPA